MHTMRFLSHMRKFNNEMNLREGLRTIYCIVFPYTTSIDIDKLIKLAKGDKCTVNIVVDAEDKPTKFIISGTKWRTNRCNSILTTVFPEIKEITVVKKSDIRFV